MSARKLTRPLSKSPTFSLPKSLNPNSIYDHYLLDLEPSILDPLPTVSLSQPAPRHRLALFLQSHLPPSFTAAGLLHFLRRRLRHHPSFAPYDLHVFLWAASSSDTFHHDHSTYEHMVRSLAASSRLDSLRLLLRLLLSHPCPCSGNPTAAGIFSCPRLPQIYRTAIAAFAGAGRLDAAADALADARRSIDGRLDPALYNLLIHAHARSGDHRRAVEWYKIMLKDRVKAESHTFNILINSACRNLELMSAVDWFREMKTKNLQPNVVSFNTLIRGFFREKRFKEGIGIAREMLDLGFRLSIATCEILVHGLCRDGRTDEAGTLLTDLMAKGVVPEGFDCLMLVEKLCQEGKVETGMEMVELFMMKGKTVRAVTCTTLIEGLRKSGKLEESYGVMKLMLEKGMLPDRITFNCLMEDLCSFGRAIDANELRILATRKGFDPDRVTFSILARGFAREGRKKEGEGVVDEMLDAGFIANIATYNRLIKELQTG